MHRITRPPDASLPIAHRPRLQWALTGAAILAFALGASVAQSAISAKPFSAKPLTSLSGEILTASTIQFHGCHGQPLETTFQASGSATGPFPGTFTVTGEWHPNNGGSTIISQSFVITSGNGTISGTILGLSHLFTCGRFPDSHYYAMTYSSGSSSGHATTTGISASAFEETFQ
jgi:hypothetical protein